MSTFNFHNKTFQLLSNSSNGQVSDQTIFKYSQQGHLVTADYYGGSVLYGKIIAQLKGDKLNMLYQCLTKDDKLKAGKAIAKISLTEKNKIQLNLDWEWLETGEKGNSIYLEK